jgi:CRISPR-associated protein, csn1 family
MDKKILGLDLGVGSIGWSLITLDEGGNPAEILGMGSRIVPLTSDDMQEFQKGKAITKNKDRTMKRSARRGLDRYQQRRAKLSRLLSEFGLGFPRPLMSLSPLTLWGLRADAATEGKVISLAELGRVLYHLNQKRGYRHSKSDESSKQDTEYVAAVKTRYAELKNESLTIGQYMYRYLSASAERGADALSCVHYRVKDQVYPREAYMEEFDRIMAVQQKAYPEVLTSVVLQKLRDCIFFQRPLKSCKHLVSYCEFERKTREVQIPVVGADGTTSYKTKIVDIGPKVAPVSSPLAEVCRLWESINNVRIYYPDGAVYPLSLEHKQAFFNKLQESESLKFSDAKKIIGAKAKDKLWCNDLLKSGIKGNRTTATLRKLIEDYPQYKALLRFDLKQEDSCRVDLSTGEVLPLISVSYLNEPLYKLWHILYSVAEREAMGNALRKQLGVEQGDLDKGLLDACMKIDFTKQGYCNKSAKFMCKLLPYLQQGYMYSEAADLAGYKHSDSKTKEELEHRALKPRIELLPKNSLRQPIVEKVLNQMINLVNALKDKYGEIDEVRVELARELKMGREERETTSRRIAANEKDNKRVAEAIAEYGTPTKNRIQKYKLWEEANYECIYCGKQIGLANLFSDGEAEIEHIIPRSVLYDDSMSNKTCACRSCNKAKNNRAAMDWVLTQTEEFQTKYFNRLEGLVATKRLSNGKRQRLMTLLKDIPEDFIERHLRLTQYISRKATEILKDGIRYVWSSEGSVTSTLRHLWGYDKVLEDLNFERYKSMGETQTILVKRGSVEQEVERIKDWNKRKDHRHHAIDALVVACTRQSYIQRLNRLSSEEDRQSMQSELGSSYAPSKEERMQLLDKWLTAQPHFSVQAVRDYVRGILVSFRPDRRTYTKSRNKVKIKGRVSLQTGILTPRGALSEETIYGAIQVGKRKEIVCKYRLENLQAKDVPSIVDKGIQRIIKARLETYNNDAKKAFAEPLYSDAAQTKQIRSVRCFTGRVHEKMIPLRRNDAGEEIAFVAPGSNHHVAFYRDSKGVLQEAVVSFYQAIERAKYQLPMIIKDPRAVVEEALERNVPDSVLSALPHSSWTFVESLQKNEMFLIGLSDDEIARAIKEADRATLNDHLYRVQKYSSKYYCFRYHIETLLDEIIEGDIPKLYRIRSEKSYLELNPRKVRVDLLGNLSLLE